MGISGAGVFLTACLCGTVTTAALGEVGHGPCPMHREVCDIEALPPVHGPHRDPTPGRVNPYVSVLVVSSTTAGTFITPRTGSLTISSDRPTLQP